MSIDNPRRIFRRGRSLGGAALVLACIGLALTAGVMGMDALSAWPADTAASGPARVISALPDKVAVIDGGTLRLDGEVVRLSDIEAPARGQSCAAGPDCGGRATAVLASLVDRRPVACRVSGYDRMGRPWGRCDAGGRDVNIALVAAGWARAETPDLDAAEADARSHRRGIWLSN